MRVLPQGAHVNSLLVCGCLILALWLLPMIDVSLIFEVIFVVTGKFKFPKSS